MLRVIRLFKKRHKDPCLSHNAPAICNENVGFRRITLFCDELASAFVVPNGHFPDMTKGCLRDILLSAWESPSLTYDGKVLSYESRHDCTVADDLGRIGFNRRPSPLLQRQPEPHDTRRRPRNPWFAHLVADLMDRRCACCCFKNHCRKTW